MKRLLDIMKKLNENKNGDVITFDFDNTIVKSFENKNDGMEIQYQFGGTNPEIIARIKKFKQQGKTVFVVTARNVALENPTTSVKTMLKGLNLDVDGIFYTNGQPKAKKLYELGSSLHYDDDPKETEAIEAYTNLHGDFNIKVIDGDSLLSDINEVAKGILRTTDNKFIIVQRSDSMEWDAPGGHLMQGENGAFALWREVKEELGLKITDIRPLDRLLTTWKGKQTPVHYFLASVPYSSDELDGAIALQWELADYFCSDLKEIDEKLATPDGGTQNLRNVINLILDNHNILAESRDYQKKSEKIKSYNHDAAELLSTGPAKHPYASGIKDVDPKRGKSAPPGAPGGGWGSMEEEKEEKRRSKLKIRFLYDLDGKKKNKKKKKGKKPGPKKGSKQKKRRNRGNFWPYGGAGGYSTIDFGDGGGDGGGGE